LPELVATLNAYQPELLMTYPSFARRILEEQESGRLQIRPRRIGSTAEVLSPDVRSRVRATWNAPVLDTYGTTEAGLLGTECDAVRGIHIAEDMVVFEVVDERNRRVPAGTPGSKVLLTSLFNRTLPLIRYELSDLVTLAEGACECGRPYARVTAIEGRREDYLVFHAKGGGSVRIHAARLRGPLDGVPGLRQFQLVPGEGRLTLRLSVRGDARADEIVASALAAVRTALAEADADVQVTGELVDAIERAGTGAKEKLVALA
jgi:phenylacetate-coenzyme A ligase PaaK-like adenylate-forming protein